MSRVQLALTVSDVDQAVAFYSKLFATEPAKRKPGYANFAIDEPPLKLVLIEGDEPGTLNHLGIEVETGQEVEAAEARLSAEGMSTTGVDDTTCCYAFKTETWVNDPDRIPWEVYVKTGDAEQLSPRDEPGTERTACCSPSAIRESVAAGSSPAGECC